MLSARLLNNEIIFHKKICKLSALMDDTSLFNSIYSSEPYHPPNTHEMKGTSDADAHISAIVFLAET